MTITKKAQNFLVPSRVAFSVSHFDFELVAISDECVERGRLYPTPNRDIIFLYWRGSMVWREPPYRDSIARHIHTHIHVVFWCAAFTISTISTECLSFASSAFFVTLELDYHINLHSTWQLSSDVSSHQWYLQKFSPNQPRDNVGGRENIRFGKKVYF